MRGLGAAHAKEELLVLVLRYVRGAVPNSPQTGCEPRSKKGGRVEVVVLAAVGRGVCELEHGGRGQGEVRAGLSDGEEKHGELKKRTGALFQVSPVEPNMPGARLLGRQRCRGS